MCKNLVYLGSTSLVTVHIITLFLLCFCLRCLRQVKVQRRMVQSRRLLAALLTDRAR
ncbi:hypothetical protein NP493_7889g00000 [Ridgeia piscesae]|uniref:Uncharacterized protein n=1 Tax=Ridgeia piscesae TaxID=27915 RepID=A0AAD9MNQ6_RIDPI|nr:hypothetical protein NP493_7889g00000 [Ridgeia piscesae]